eukprot:m.281977 g.281977  ORF g.281977 m.281977 type:complete len:381 (+) comp11108_c0_seq18:953-2095(+)
MRIVASRSQENVSSRLLNSSVSTTVESQVEPAATSPTYPRLGISVGLTAIATRAEGIPAAKKSARVYASTVGSPTMSGLREFVTLVSNDPLTRQVEAGKASFVCPLGAPLELADGADYWEVALVSVSMSGVPVGGTGSFYVMCSAVESTSRLGSQKRAFLQAIPGEASAIGDLSFVNEGAALVIFRPAAESVYSEIEFAIQNDNGDLVDCTYASVTLALLFVGSPTCRSPRPQTTQRWQSRCTAAWPCTCRAATTRRPRPLAAACSAARWPWRARSARSSAPRSSAIARQRPRPAAVWIAAPRLWRCWTACECDRPGPDAIFAAQFFCAPSYSPTAAWPSVGKPASWSSPLTPPYSGRRSRLSRRASSGALSSDWLPLQK